MGAYESPKQRPAGEATGATTAVAMFVGIHVRTLQVTYHGHVTTPIGCRVRRSRSVRQLLTPRAVATESMSPLSPAHRAAGKSRRQGAIDHVGDEWCAPALDGPPRGRLIGTLVTKAVSKRSDQALCVADDGGSQFEATAVCVWRSGAAVPL